MPASKAYFGLQRGVNLFELSREKVSAQLQPATAGHARLVLRKQLEQIYTSLYMYHNHEAAWMNTHLSDAWKNGS